MYTPLLRKRTSSDEESEYKRESKYSDNDTLGALRSPLRCKMEGDTDMNRRGHGQRRRWGRSSSHEKPQHLNKQTLDQFAPGLLNKGSCKNTSRCLVEFNERTSRQKLVPLRCTAPEHNKKLAGDEQKRDQGTELVLTDTMLARRQKDIDYGKITDGYQNYIRKISKDHRRPGFPQTPDKMQLCSRRTWDYQVRKWRRDLHKWDPPGLETSIIREPSEDQSSSPSSVLSTSPQTSVPETVSDLGYETTPDLSQPHDEFSDDFEKTISGFRSGKFKTWEEMLLEEEENEDLKENRPCDEFVFNLDEV